MSLSWTYAGVITILWCIGVAAWTYAMLRSRRRAKYSEEALDALWRKHNNKERA